MGPVLKYILQIIYKNWFLSSILKGFLQARQQFFFKDFLLPRTARMSDRSSPCPFPGMPAFCNLKAKARFVLKRMLLRLNFPKRGPFGVMKCELVPDTSILLPDLLAVPPSHGQAPWEVSYVPVFRPKRPCFQVGRAGADLLVLLMLLESLGWSC